MDKTPDDELRDAMMVFPSIAAQHESLKWLLIHLYRMKGKVNEGKSASYDAHCARTHLDSLENVLNGGIRK